LNNAGNHKPNAGNRPLRGLDIPRTVFADQRLQQQDRFPCGFALSFRGAPTDSRLVFQDYRAYQILKVISSKSL
jgi:hypothetical protein